jgi:hypothetical protein
MFGCLRSESALPYRSLISSISSRHAVARPTSAGLPDKTLLNKRHRKSPVESPYISFMPWKLDDGRLPTNRFFKAEGNAVDTNGLPSEAPTSSRVITPSSDGSSAIVISKGVPAVAAIAAQIAELEDLITSRNALALTLRPVVAELREKMASIQRANWRKAQGLKLTEIPAEEAYRAAVADMVATLRGSNVEAARAALRGLTGDIPVFEQGGKLYGRLTVDAIPLYSRCNPALIDDLPDG